MIDIENMVIDKVITDLATTITDMPIEVTSGYDEEKAAPRTVVVRETGSVDYHKTATDANSENHARLTYEIEIYSNKQNTGRSECKRIINAVDDIMKSMKFRRIYKSRPFNINRTRWRQYARYEVIVGQPVTYDANTANERTVFQMYRR